MDRFLDNWPFSQTLLDLMKWLLMVCFASTCPCQNDLSHLGFYGIPSPGQGLWPMHDYCEMLRLPMRDYCEVSCLVDLVDFVGLVWAASG